MSLFLWVWAVAFVIFFIVTELMGGYMTYMGNPSPNNHFNIFALSVVLSAVLSFIIAGINSLF